MASYDQNVIDLIERYAAKLQAFAAQWTDSPEDVVQEVFCRLVEQRQLPKQPAGWLFRVARNHLHQEYRARRRRIRRERAVARRESGISNLESGIAQRELTQMLNDLKPKLYEVVILRHWSHLSFDEIAQACGASTATVHRRYQKAIELLKQRLNANVN